MGLFPLNSQKISMLMPEKNQRAIYEHLFKEGVMVAKKDHHAPKHPELESVPNLHVIKALTSLKSRGYVKEQFAWRHYYWYLTNEGIGYLRNYLHLPLKLSPPHSKGNRGQMPDQDQVLPLEDVLLETNPPMVIVLLTEERLVLMAIRLALPDLDLLPWNSEEDSAEARRNKFIMSKLKKKGLIKTA